MTEMIKENVKNFDEFYFFNDKINKFVYNF